MKIIELSWSFLLFNTTFNNVARLSISKPIPIPSFQRAPNPISGYNIPWHFFFTLEAWFNDFKIECENFGTWLCLCLEELDSFSWNRRVSRKLVIATLRSQTWIICSTKPKCAIPIETCTPNAEVQPGFSHCP